jgi:1,4-dihydroxy-2-naphthoate octaprenyltransferase
VGTGVAYPSNDWLHASLALVVALALQVGVNYANDYSDGVRGTDEVRVGPMRLVATGTKPARAVKRAAFLSFGVAAVAGFALALRTSPWLIAVGLAAIVAAWRYTGGESPYGYRGLGEVFVFIFFGPVAVVGTAFVQSRSLTWVAWVASIPIGLIICAILVVNNLRDRPRDAQVGKHTVAVRLGDRLTRALFIILILAPFVVALAVMPERPWAWLTLGAMPQAIWLSRFVAAGAVGMDLVRALARTSGLLLAFSTLFTVGLVL